MALPKRRTSKRRIRIRKASHKKAYVSVKACPNCGAPQQPHRVCRSCGFYGGKQVQTVEAK